MAFKVLPTSTLPIGIDLGTSTVKLAQLRRLRDELELLAAASAEIPDVTGANPHERAKCLGRLLRTLLKQAGFKGRRCIISLPAAATVVQHIRTARMGPEELEQAVRRELQGKLPFDPSEAIIRHMPVGETGRERDGDQELIVLSASRAVVEEYLELARRARLEVAGLNVEPCAIIQCFARLFRRGDDAHRVTLFLDLGRGVTQVVIARGPRLVFARNVMYGAKEIEEAAAKALGQPVEEVSKLRGLLSSGEATDEQAERVYAAAADGMDSLVNEITRCLRYYDSNFPSKPVERAVFLGGQALDRRLCQMVAEGLNLPAQIGDPFARISAGTGESTVGLDRRQVQPAWAVAVGLSIGSDLRHVA